VVLSATSDLTKFTITVGVMTNGDIMNSEKHKKQSEQVLLGENTVKSKTFFPARLFLRVLILGSMKLKQRDLAERNGCKII